MSVVPFHQPHPPGCTCQMCCQIDSDTVRCWQQMQMFEQMITDIVNKIFANPTPEMLTSITNIFNTTVVSTMGVTDGSNPKPGQVGEYITGSAAMQWNLPAGTQQQEQTYTPIVIPPGDWDVEAIFYPGHNYTGILVNCAPAPTGLQYNLKAQLFSWTTGPTGQDANVIDSSMPTGRARMSVTVPTPLPFVVAMWNASTEAISGTSYLGVTARRMR